MVCEFTGETVKNLSMDERMVLTNMTAEVGAKTGIIEPDKTTLNFLSSKVSEKIDMDLASDKNANYSSIQEFDANILEPQVAAPHSPANSKNLSNFEGTNIDQAYIGACTGAKLEDLQMAATVLKGKNCSKNTRLLVAPASARITAAAAADGTLETLTESGAIMLPSGCGACAGLGAGILSNKEVCISTTNRNFKGRMGDQEAEVYLGSPYTVAAAAVAGRIIDPRDIT